jgi:uncharacterized Zn-finger protein
MTAAPPPPEILYVDERAVACDGGDGALGHPRVYLRMDGSDAVTCPYCDRLYILSGGDSDHRSTDKAA